jgi:hypothetical protein
MIHEIIELDTLLNDLPFSGSELKNFLFSNKIVVSLLLSFKKAKQWPYSKIPFNNEDLEKIPVLWAFLYADLNGNINFYLGIHPMKCFPSLYLKNNENYKSFPIQIIKKGGLTWAGCYRYVVNVDGKNYNLKQCEYCSSFGLPDDCYSKKFGREYIDLITNLKEYDIWFFEKDDVFQNFYPKNFKILYMKDEFLPKQFFFYVDTSSNFLSGLFPARDLASLNKNWWYTSGKNFIKERNYFESEKDFRYEEYSLINIKRKAIFELIRLVLLLQNKDQFKDFSIPSMPTYDEKAKNSTEVDLYEIINEIKTKSEKNLNSLIKSIEGGLDQRKLRKTKFLVMDVEFVRVHYPTKKYSTKKRKLQDIRSFKFPSIFTSIIWNGKKKHAEIDINIFTLPCHYCVENCRVIKYHSMKFKCLYFANSFIVRQTSFFEKYLAEHESAKIFSYGKSDIKQLEHSDIFFSNSFNTRLYRRKNRKKSTPIVNIASDISITGMSLSEVEEKIIKNWLIGWSREGYHKNVNRNFTTTINDKDFTKRYHDAIETCVSDSISTFLFLLQRDYRKDNNPIRLEHSSQAALF